MTRRHRDLISKYLADLSKGVLIAAFIGVSTVKLPLGWFVLDLVGAALTLAYWLEGMNDDTQ